jgi:peroxiredoxin Q/BCP
VDRDIAIIGISKDDEKSIKKFVDKFELPFVMLSDTELKAIKAYGVLNKAETGAARVTFVIDEGGIIEKVFEKAKAATNAADVLEYLGG